VEINQENGSHPGKLYLILLLEASPPNQETRTYRSRMIQISNPTRLSHVNDWSRAADWQGWVWLVCDLNFVIPVSRKAAGLTFKHSCTRRLHAHR
jgi:hypothetical protein